MIAARSSSLLLLVLSLLASAACEPARSPGNAGAGASMEPQAIPPAHPTPPAALLVLAKKDETRAIVDPATLAVIARVPVGHDPHEVVASPDGKLAYVSNYGRGAFDTIAVVDLVTQRPRPSIALGALRGPHGMAYAGGKVWFTAEGAKVVGAYDPGKGVVETVVGTGQDRTHMLLVSPDAARIVTTNVSSGTVGFLDRGTDWEQTLVAVGAGTEGFDIAPGGQELWAADAQDGSIAVVDVAGKKLAQRLDAKVVGANRLKITPDGRWALVSSLRGPDLVVFDVASRAEARRIPLGAHGAAGILVQGDGTRAFVSCSPDDFVAVVDLRTMAVTAKIQAGREPDGLAWAAH